LTKKIKWPYYKLPNGGSMKPNIFSYATSELSQDAFFCWLLEWSKKEYTGEELNTISLNFINHILEKTNKNKINAVDKIEIRRQETKIDFYVKINDAIIILFEDKTGTQHHDNQLLRYKQYIEKAYKNYQYSYVYLKSGIIWNTEKKEVEEAGYFMIDIFDILKIFKKPTNNELFNDYIQTILLKINIYNSYNTLPFTEWKNNDEAWLGFYAYLESKIDDTETKFWAGSLKVWVNLGYCDYWKEYEDEIDDTIDAGVLLGLDRNKIVIDVITGAKVDLSAYQEYFSEIVEKNSIGTIDNLRFGGKPGNKKNIRIIHIEDIIIINQDGIMDSEKTLNKIIDIRKKFYECFKNK
jgi:hypothetical protein